MAFDISSLASLAGTGLSAYGASQGGSGQTSLNVSQYPTLTANQALLQNSNIMQLLQNMGTGVQSYTGQQQANLSDPTLQALQYYGGDSAVAEYKANLAKQNQITTEAQTKEQQAATKKGLTDEQSKLFGWTQLPQGTNVAQLNSFLSSNKLSKSQKAQITAAQTKGIPLDQKLSDKLIKTFTTWSAKNPMPVDPSLLTGLNQTQQDTIQKYYASQPSSSVPTTADQLYSDKRWAQDSTIQGLAKTNGWTPSMSQSDTTQLQALQAKQQQLQSGQQGGTLSATDTKTLNDLLAKQTAAPATKIVGQNGGQGGNISGYEQGSETGTTTSNNGLSGTASSAMDYFKNALAGNSQGMNYLNQAQPALNTMLAGYNPANQDWLNGSGATQNALNAAMQGWDPQSQDWLYGTGASQSALQKGLADYDPTSAKAAWQSSLVDPAMRNWNQNVAPEILEKYAGTGAMNRELARSGRDLSSDLASQLSGMLYQGEQAQLDRQNSTALNVSNMLSAAQQAQLGRQASTGLSTAGMLQNAQESALGRQQTGINQSLNMAQMPGALISQAQGVGSFGNDLMNQIANYGTLSSNYEQTNLTNNQNNWAYSQPYNNPYTTQTGNAYTPAFENVGTTSTSGTNSFPWASLAGAALSSGAGQSMLTNFLGGA
jgi:hypothetical protein